ncbi:hypothetical protein [Mycobacterium sp. 1081908.1]|uniref:hypothetical protein n=1 Tax=Mycobacterium sp. 1081908.1 TaxID=1834066 RepID=UPI0007FF13B5|nr:hypothetical protein [Mycobacterium sp. 1081908.1]OBK51659.1 hypothetical protein A5655_23300 [Mycobacterium sp. 1081908.1]
MSAVDDEAVDAFAAERVTQAAAWIDKVIAVVRAQHPGEWDSPWAARRLQRAACVLADIMEDDIPEKVYSFDALAVAIWRLAVLAEQVARKRSAE